MPNFRLPWPENLNGNVYFTGGPHAYSAGGNFTTTYEYGYGTGIDFAAKGKSFPVIAMASGNVIAATCHHGSYPELGCIVAVKHSFGTSVLIYGHLKENSESYQRLKTMYDLFGFWP
ncbi:unnamed protein product, partial [marine sediment metagenome]